MGETTGGARRRAIIIAACTVLALLAPTPAMAAIDPSPPPSAPPSISPEPDEPVEPEPSPEPSAPPAQPSPPETSAPSPTPSPAPSSGQGEEGALPSPTPDPAPAQPDATALEAAAASTADRLAGESRYHTAIAVSQHAHPAGARTVFIADGRGFADALSAGPAAAQNDAPLLLVPGAWLPTYVSDELRRLSPTRIVVLGGAPSVSDGVLQALRSFAPTVERVAGADRFETSRAIARRFFPSSTSVLITTGMNFPDALAAGGAAASVNAPIVLVDGRATVLDQPSRELLTELSAQQVTILGDGASVPEGIASDLVATGVSVERLGGRDRFETAVLINKRFFPAATRAFLANGLGFADALAGGALAGLLGAPLYSSPAECPTMAALDDALGRLGVSQVTIIGGYPSMSRDAEQLRGCWPAKQARIDSQDALVAKLEATMAGLPGRYQVSVRELGGMERSVDVRGDALVEPASVIKIFAAYVILDRIDRGQLRWSTPTRSGVQVFECLRVMIHISDNSCHADLLALVGNDAINRTLWSAGFTETFYVGYDGAGRYQSAKKSSTSDLVALLSRLEQGTLLSAPSTAYLQTQLSDQLWRSKIPSGIPAGVEFGNKTGSLWTTEGLMEGDAGIVRAPSGTYAVSIIGIRDARNWGVARLSRVIYEHLSSTSIAPASWGATNLVTTERTYMYSDAGRTAIGWFEAGTRFDADVSNRVWYRVIHQGQYRWVHHGDVETQY